MNGVSVVMESLDRNAELAAAAADAQGPESKSTLCCLLQLVACAVRGCFFDVRVLLQLTLCTQFSNVLTIADAR